MKIRHSTWLDKYVASYQGKTIGIGNTHAEAIGHALQVITQK